MQAKYSFYEVAAKPGHNVCFQRGHPTAHLKSIRNNESKTVLGNHYSTGHVASSTIIPEIKRQSMTDNSPMSNYKLNIVTISLAVSPACHIKCLIE